MAAKIHEYEEFRRERDRLKNPAKQLREWDKEYRKVVTEEVAMLAEELKSVSDEIAKSVREAISPMTRVVDWDLPLEGISPSVPVR